MSRLEDSPAADATTITVTVVFFADLRRFLPRGEGGPQRYRVKPGATVTDLLETIGIALDTDLTAAVDGELAARDTPLREGAEVMLLSPMEGGSGSWCGAVSRAGTPGRQMAELAVDALEQPRVKVQRLHDRRSARISTRRSRSSFRMSLVPESRFRPSCPRVAIGQNVSPAKADFNV